jgi:hypothetical protein
MAVVQSSLTIKLQDDNQSANRPREDNEVQWWREWLVKIIFGLWNQKKEILKRIGFPPRPISQREIFKEKCRRVEMLKQERLWGVTKEYPYAVDHGHNWIERRVNECATEKFGPKLDGVVKIVNTSARNGLYEPNPELFTKRC